MAIYVRLALPHALQKYNANLHGVVAKALSFRVVQSFIDVYILGAVQPTRSNHGTSHSVSRQDPPSITRKYLSNLYI